MHKDNRSAHRKGVNVDDDVKYYVASIIQRQIDETQIDICYKVIKEAGLAYEFAHFVGAIPFDQEGDIFTIFRDFALLHPDKLYVPKENETYSNFIEINKEA